MLTGVCPSIEARAAKSRQQPHRSQYDNKIAHLSALSPVSIIKLRGAAIKPATVGEVTIESMDRTEQQGRQQQGTVKTRRQFYFVTYTALCWDHSQTADQWESLGDTTAISTACFFVYLECFTPIIKLKADRIFFWVKTTIQFCFDLRCRSFFFTLC